MREDCERRHGGALLLVVLTLLPVLLAVGGPAAALASARARDSSAPPVLSAPATVPQLPPPALGPAVPAAARAQQDRDVARASRTQPRPVPPPSPAPARASSPARSVGSLRAAIARLPGDRAESARWVPRAIQGHWGATDWRSQTIYISPRTPSARLYSVVAHEWSHLLQVRTYDGDVAAAVHATNRHFGGSGLVGAERAADCMALLQGATWTHYTPCRDASWRRAAARLLAGQQL